MAVIRPFKAYRPAKGMEEKIAALPYDVYNRQEATQVVSDNPVSFLSIDRAETLLPASVDTYADEVYKLAHDRLWDFVEKGYFVQDTAPLYYLYELTMNGRSQTGIVACASIDDYQNNVIKKHENTRSDKEQDRIRHVDTCNMQTGPIFLAYRQTLVLKQIIQKVKSTAPVYDFASSDDITHKVWLVDNTDDIETIEKAFADINSIYIADGHHRCASAVKVGLKRREERGASEADYFLSVLFPDEELMIMDYNRFVKDLNGMNPEEFLEKLQTIFEIDGTECNNDSSNLVKVKDLGMLNNYDGIRPQKKGELAMYLGGSWYRLRIKDQFLNSDPVKGLDVSLLQDLVLQPMLNIDDPKTNKRIDFIGGIRGLKELERRCAEQGINNSVAFAMYPTSIGELFAVADAGMLMPPKSTWFEPKLRSGLFLHEI